MTQEDIKGNEICFSATTRIGRSVLIQSAIGISAMRSAVAIHGGQRRAADTHNTREDRAISIAAYLNSSYASPVSLGSTKADINESTYSLYIFYLCCHSSVTSTVRAESSQLKYARQVCVRVCCLCLRKPNEASTIHAQH